MEMPNHILRFINIKSAQYPFALAAAKDTTHTFWQGISNGRFSECSVRVVLIVHLKSDVVP